MMNSELQNLAADLGDHLGRRGWRLTTAESCTGGYIGKVLTDIAGSSAWYDCGFITYSNSAKQKILGVPAATLREAGAVSEATVLAMAEGALRVSGQRLAVAVSGVAGPGGGTEVNPVGSVWLAWACRDRRPLSEHFLFNGDRAAVRRQTVREALLRLIQISSEDSR